MLKLQTTSGHTQTRLRPARLVMALCAVAVLTACSQSTEDMMASARDYLSRNDISAAGIQLKNVLQQDGSIAEARFLLGSIYLEERDFPAAVRELRRAQELGYPAVQVVPVLSRAMVLNGDLDRVVQDFANVTLDDAEAQSRVLAHVGDAQFGRGNAEAARDFYEAALSAKPDFVLARVGLSRALLFVGEHDRAMTEAETVLAAQPDNADAHVVRAEVLRVRDQPDEVVTALDAALSASPETVNTHFALIAVLVEQDRIDEAELRLREMQRVAANDPATLYLQAFLDFRKDRLDSARESVEALLRLAPNHLLGDLLAGNIYVRQGDHLRGRQHLERVLARMPDQALARRALAASHLATGNAMQARDVLRPLLESGVEDLAAFNLAGQIFLALGEFEQASDYLGRVSAVNPSDFRARTGLGLARMGQGAGEAGLAELEAVAAVDDGGHPDALLVLAHVREQRFEQALEVHARLESRQPNVAQTHNLKGGIMLAMQDRPAARAAFARALEVDSFFLPAAVNLSRLDIADGLVGDARARFNAIIDANPNRFEPYLLMADLLRQTGGTPAEVRSVLERGVSANPSARALRIALARQLAEMGELRPALSIAQELVAADSEEPAALTLLAQVQAVMGDRQQSISNINRVVRLQPNSPAPLVLLAEVQRADNDRRGAEQSLRSALSLQPDLFEAQQRLIMVLAEQRKLGQAITVAQDVQRQRPDAFIGFALEGDLMASDGKWTDAAQSYLEASKRGAGPDVIVKLHRSLLELGRVDEAAALTGSWLDTNPNDIVMRAYLAERAIASGEHAEAEALYRKILPMQPDNALILNNLAWVAGQLGREDALPLALRALEQAPTSAAVLDTVAELQIKAGLHDEGVATHLKAVELSPDTPLLRLNLAKTYLKLGRTADAGRELDLVLQQAPEGSPLAIEAAELRRGN